MGLDDPADDRQAQADAAKVPVARLLEPAEDVGDLLRGDSRAGIGDREPNLALDLLAGDIDPAAGRRELERVAHQVREDLRKAWPATHLRLGEVLVSFGELLLDDGRPQEAETLLREALGIRREHFGDEDAPVAELKRALAGALRAQGRHTEAAALMPETPSRP